MKLDASQFRLTGYEIPEHGGAGYPALICIRCDEEIIDADSTRRNELTRLRGWGDTIRLDRVLEIAERHRCAKGQGA